MVSRVQTRLSPEFHVLKSRLLAERSVSETKREDWNMLKSLERELVFLQSDREKMAQRSRQLKLGADYITWLKDAAPKKYSPDPSYADMPLFTLRLKPAGRHSSVDSSTAKLSK